MECIYIYVYIYTTPLLVIRKSYTPTPPPEPTSWGEEKYPSRTYCQRREDSQVHFFEGPFWVLFLEHFLDYFCPQNSQQNGSNICPKNDKKQVHFWIHFFEVLELFRWILGAFLSLLWSSWEPPRLKKYGFCIVFFGTLKLLMSVSVPSCLAPLEPIWSQN